MSDLTWERLGALSGLVVAILFGVSFIVFLTMDPMGTPRIPSVGSADEAAAFIEANRSALKVQLLLNSIAIVLFLWFLGSLWSRLRAVEVAPARISAIASAGGIVGATAVLMGFVFEAPAVVTSGLDESVVAALYALSALSIGLGAAAFTVFFAAIGKLALRTGALPLLVALLAFVAAFASALGFVTIFADTGVFNAATGAFGFWVRFAAFVIWVAVASIVLVATAGRPRRAPARR